MSPPRIIFLNRVYWPSQAATAQLLTDLAEGLAARGWEVHVIAAGHEPGPRHGVVIHRTGEGERHGGLLSRLLNFRRFIRHAGRELAALARTGDIVVPMTDPPLLGIAVARIASDLGAHVVHWIQDIYPEIVAAHTGAVAGLFLSPLRRRRDAAWRAARRCVVLGEDMARLVAAHGVPGENIAILPNWAPRELQVEPPAAAIAARRSAWGLADKFIVAYSGNLGRVHEFAAVIAAAGPLKACADVVFLFIGAGARFDEVQSAAQSLALDNIRFLPPESREHLAAALAAADAHLVTLKPGYIQLVYPSKLAGVLAAGRPVLFVGPAEGEIPRLLTGLQCGTAVGPAEGARLAEIVVAWQADPALRQRFGRSARVAAAQHFMFETALTRWENILRNALRAQ